MSWQDFDCQHLWMGYSFVWPRRSTRRCGYTVRIPKQTQLYDNVPDVQPTHIKRVTTSAYCKKECRKKVMKRRAENGACVRKSVVGTRREGGQTHCGLGSPWLLGRLALTDG